MAGMNGITNVENKKVYQITSGKKDSNNNTGFSSFLGESKSLDAIFQQAADQYHVPLNLLKAVGKAESNFKEKAVSRVGAQGIMQLMPATAKELGVTDSFDAEQNIMGGAKYLSGLLKKYDGNTSLALAAYNAGSGNVAKYGGIPPFEETQNYVKKVMKYMNQDIDTGVTTTVKSNVQSASFAGNNNYYMVDVQNTTTRDLDTTLSYEDYLMFLDLFFKETKEEEKEDKSNHNSARNINISVPVINLLKNSNI
jgi:hypothetical protein